MQCGRSLNTARAGHVQHTFFVHFFAVNAQLQSEIPSRGVLSRVPKHCSSSFFPYCENDERTTVLFRTTLTQTTSRKKLIEASDSRNHIKLKLTFLVGCWDPCGFLVMLMVQSPKDNDNIHNTPQKRTTYLSPKLTLTLTSHLGQNVGLGEG